MKRYLVGKKRGISTIIGTFFFIVIMIAAFGAILTAMTLQAQIVDQQAQLSDLIIKKLREDFSITPFCITSPAAKLGVNVSNVGANAVEVVSVWYSSSGTPYTAIPLDISLSNRYVPSGSTVDVLSDQTIVPANETYVIKVVTKLGNILDSTFVYPCSVADPEDVILAKLVARPAVFAAFPTPIGPQKTTSHAIFSIIIANPTNIDMGVSKVSFQILGGKNNQALILGGSSAFPACKVAPVDNEHEVISPKAGGVPVGTWYCGEDYVFWEDTTSIIVPKYSAQDFSIRIITKPTSSQAINNFITNAYTSFGQFGSLKTDTIGAHLPPVGVPNIYQSDDTGVPVLFTRLGLKQNVEETYYFVLENDGYWDSTKANIKDGSFLIINIPVGFSPVIPTKDPSFDLGLVWEDTTTWSDFSQHVRVKVVGDMAPSTQRIFEFKTTSPVVTSDTMYVFHANVDGYASDELDQVTAIGSIAETIVQIIP